MTDSEIKNKIIRIQEKAIGEILTLAEIGLQPYQFKQFKKKVFAIYHEYLRPETLRILNSLGVKDDDKR